MSGAASAPTPTTASGQREQATARAARLQRLAADPARHAWAAAHAGTGKTKVLIDRVLGLLLAGAPPHRILCLTYTRAAATEMRNRLALRLGEWAARDEAALAADLAALLGRAPDRAEHARARRLFAATLEAPGGLQIATLHAFCQSVLKRFPLEAGVPPHFEVLEPGDAQRLQLGARRATLADPRHALDIGIIARWTKENELAVAVRDAVSRGDFRDRLAAEGAAPAIAEAWRALGFDAPTTPEAEIDAAGALDPAHEAALRRVAAAFAHGTPPERGYAGSMAVWLAATVTARAVLFDDYAGAFLTKEGSPLKKYPTKATAAALGADVDAYRQEQERIVAVRQRIAAAEMGQATSALLAVAAAIDGRYRAAKRAAARLDYDDLIAAVDALLDPAKGALPWVMFKLDEGIDHVLVDEAQDNSDRQWRIVERLTADYFAGAGRARAGGEPTVFVVGDFKQSIFSFQGAAPAAFRRLHGDFSARAQASGRPLADVTLDVSFRSTETVLGAVDRVLALPAARPGLAEPHETIRHIAARAGLAGRVELWPLAPRPDAGDRDWSEPRIVAEPPAPHAALADAIATTIRRWLDTGERLESEGRPIRAGDVLILVRTRGQFAPRMVRALKEKGVPVAGADRMVLKNQLAVRDLAALGRFVLLPEDDLTLATVLKGPLFGFGDDAHLFPLAHGRGAASLWQRLADLAPARPDIAAARRTLAAWLDRADFAPPYEFFARIVEGEGGRRLFRARLGPEADDPIDEFLDAALDHQRRAAPSLEGFLAWLERGEDEIKRDHDGGARDEVRVMTVHGAKGLEAPIVFLPDTTGKPQGRGNVLWPVSGPGAPIWRPLKGLDTAETEQRAAESDRRDGEEHRRLLYVAMTRARDRLIVCGWAPGNGTVAPESWYGLVAASLADAPAVASADLGCPFPGEGRRLEGGAPGAAKPARVAVPPPAPPPWIGVPAPPEKVPSRPLSPSRLAEDESAPLSPFAGGDTRRWRRGRLVHRLLQSLVDLPPERRRDAAAAFLARPAHGLDAVAARAMADETLRLFDAPETAPLFAAGGLAEAPIVGTVGGVVVSGRVDRLVVADDAVWLVDYKTDRPPPADPAAVGSTYLRQMALYRALLRQAFPGRPIRCVLLWTDGPAAMTLPDPLLDRALV
jgi:ATP-dependent helicase/nuclease subunit A